MLAARYKKKARLLSAGLMASLGVLMLCLTGCWIEHPAVGIWPGSNGDDDDLLFMLGAAGLAGSAGNSGTYFALQEGNQNLYTSSDGNTWSEIVPSGLGSNSLHAIARIGGVMVGTVNLANEPIYYSTDNGSSWLTTSSGMSINGFTSIEKLIQCGTQAFAFVRDTSQTEILVYASSDGLNWTNTKTFAGESIIDYAACKDASAMIGIFGSTTVRYSSDGSNWNTSSLTSSPIFTTPAAAWLPGTTSVAIMYEESGTISVMNSTDNGANFASAVSNPGSTMIGDVYGGAFTGSGLGYVSIYARFASSYDAHPYASIDGSTWLDTGDVFVYAGAPYFYSATTVGDTILMAGKNLGNDAALMLRSDSAGAFWSDITGSLPGGTSSVSLLGVYYLSD